MGAILSRWKTKQTTVEHLEGLDKDIKDLEEFRAKNQRLQKLWVGRLLLYSSVLYLLACFWVYFWNLPDQWGSRLLLAMPLLAFPVLVWFLRRLLLYLFAKRTERNNDKLEDLKVEKRKKLEEVMETETYKSAKLILERFDPETKRKAEMETTPVRPQMTPRPGQELRQRGGASRTLVMGTPGSSGSHTSTPAGTPLHTAPGGPPERALAAAQQGMMRRPPLNVPGMGLHPPGPPLARPVLPRERGTVDRVIEYLVGDGPQNRYALICQQCFSHNGMALREEFEYLSFRCAYCYFMNPARKTRPQAPRLPEYSFEQRLRSESPSPGPSANTDDSAPPSGDERELEAQPEEVESQPDEASPRAEEEEEPPQQEEQEELEPSNTDHSTTSGQEDELHPPEEQDTQ